MRDLAKAAEVHQSTVSRALRNDPKISEKIRKKVQAAAKELGYRPNPFVQAFTAQVRGYRKSPTHASIVLLESYDSKYDTSFLQRYRDGATEHAAELGYNVETISLCDLSGSVPRINSIFKARGIRGALILPPPSDISLNELSTTHLAGATIDYSLKSPQIHRSAPNYFLNMELALSKLHALGYRRIGLCTYKEALDRMGHHWLGSFLAWQSLRPTKERISVHVNPFRNIYEPKNPKEKREADDIWIKSRKAFQSWLDKCKPDVVLSNDFFFYEWLKELGHKVPEEIGFATLNTYPSRPDISGVDENHETIGASAVDLILGQFHRNNYGLPDLCKTVLIEGTWLEGETTLAR